MLADRIGRVSGAWRIGIDLADGRRVVADCASGTVAPRTTADTVDCDLRVADGDLRDLLLGKLDIRGAFLFRQAQVEGPMRPTVEFFDALAGNGMRYRSDLPGSRPTTDLATARRDLDEAGYCLIADALDAATLARISARVDEQAAREAAAGVGHFEGAMADGSPGHPVQRLYALMNKGQDFIDLLDHPLIDAVIPERLGGDCVLSTFFTIAAGPGCAPLGLHFDQISIVPVVREFAVGYNLVFFLDDFTDANGATRVIPGSHRDANRLAPADILSMDGTIAAEAPAGTALIFDSRLWHGTGANRTGGKRRGLFLYYVRPWMRTTENWSLSVHPDTFDRLSDKQKARLGFRHTAGLGRVQSSTEGSIVRDDPDRLVLQL
jgi:ectoine hydroxylase-related dioxygenase (phytanoyl-CoA dioxygenase family)